MSHSDDHLAYGRYPPQRGDHSASGGGGTRALMGDTFKLLKDSYKSHSQSRPQDQSYHPQDQHGHGYPSHQSGHQPGPSHHNPPYHGQSAKPDKLSGFLGKLQDTVVDFGSEFAGRVGTAIDPQGYAEYGQQKPGTTHRFGSFAPPRSDTDVKWHVGGCNYFYAVSRALESAKESIWILDWWLSPELYLRRPPAKNEQYRLDRMLQSAAQRGVKVNVIVYKEVTQALTLSSSHTKHHLEDLHPNIAVFRHPDHLPDRQQFTSSITESLQNPSLDASTLTQLPGDTIKGLYGMSDDAILYWAHHEKLCLIDGRVAFMGGLDLCFGRWDTHQHAIADVHSTDLNEIVFPGQDYNNARVLDFHDVVNWEQNQLERKATSRMGWSDVSVSLHGPAVEDLRRHFVERWNFIYDSKYDSRTDPRYARLVLYGRPSSSIGHQNPPSGSPATSLPQHHQGALHQPGTLTPGGGHSGSTHQSQVSSPVGYSQSPSAHEDTYAGESFPPPPPGPPPGQSAPIYPHGPSQNPVPSFPPPPGQTPVPSHSPGQVSSPAPYFAPPPTQEVPHQGPPHQQSRGMDDYGEGPETARGEADQRGFGLDPRRFKGEFSEYGSILRGQLAGQIHQYQNRLTSFGGPRGNMRCQILRSCCKWSHGGRTEHSISDAYAAVIRNSEHFVYIENQFFITATGDAQKPVENKIGAAIVERILRAARAGQKYKIVVVIPSVPCFAGDLADDSTLGTRAIMEFQYNSINRGGHSIMEMIAREGYNPMEYIRFYNLRNYDRINASGPMMQAEQWSGVSYEDARKQHDLSTAGHGGYGPGSHSAFDTTAPFQQYQQAAHQVSGFKPSSGRWNSVSECYMLNGEDIRNVPWEGPSEAEIDAFVSEELYVHSKVMIADDRVVLCGSANLNDRSQLGTHDSEIAVMIEDYTPVQSTMDGQPWTASRFGASLRRELFRKHLGLLPPQDHRRAGADFEPVGVPNRFDFDTPESQVVADPLAYTLQSLWNTRSKTNTEVFRRVFHAVPDDTVRNWATYKEFYGYYFNANKDQERPARYGWGHVVRDDFPPGPEGARQVKELLSQVKGTLVEMPLMFLIEEDVAKSGLTLNDWTEPLYT